MDLTNMYQNIECSKSKKLSFKTTKHLKKKATYIDELTKVNTDVMFVYNQNVVNKPSKKSHIILCHQKFARNFI